MSATDLATFCRQLPKIELHIHLEGSIQPGTLFRLAKQRGVDLPANDVAGLEEWFRFRDFDHFVEVYLLCSACLQHPEDFQLVVRDFLEEQARQNVLYSEVHFTIGTHLTNGVNGEEVADALWEAICDGERDLGTSMRLIPDIVRNVGQERADRTLEWALESREKGVVALGISGSERFANDPYQEHFEVAADEGMHRVAHAGEHAGPESIRSAIELLGPERIGHGVTAVEDPRLVEELASVALPLEVCPSSNVALGASESLEKHPFDRLRAAGVEVSVNSDDPPFFNTTLSQEYERLAGAFSYDRSELARLALRAIDHAFVGSEQREALGREMRSQMSRLGIDSDADGLSREGD